MFCSNCGKEIDVQMKFCQHCGAQNLAAAQQENTPPPTHEPIIVPPCKVEENAQHTVENQEDYTPEYLDEPTPPVQEASTAPEDDTIGCGISTMQIFTEKTTYQQTNKKDTPLWHNLSGWHIVATKSLLFQALLCAMCVPVLALLAIFAVLFVLLCFDSGFSLVYLVLLGIPLWILQECGKRPFLEFLFGAKHTEGNLYLPEHLTRDAALSKIEQEFLHPFIDTVKRQNDTVIFTGKKATVLLSIDEEGIQCKMLDRESKRQKKQYLYYLLCNSVKTQVISLLYPELIAPELVVEEQKYIKKSFQNHKRNFWLRVVGVLALLAWCAVLVIGEFGGMESIQSKGISNSSLDIFTTGVTLDETLDSFFSNGSWSNDGGADTTIVTYTGTCRNATTGENVSTSIYFVMNNDTNYFSLDSIYMDGDALNIFEMMALVAVINENYGENETVDIVDAFSEALDELAEEEAASEATALAEQQNAEEEAAAQQAAEEAAAQAEADAQAAAELAAALAEAESLPLDDEIIDLDEIGGMWQNSTSDEVIVINAIDQIIYFGDEGMSYDFENKSDGSALLSIGDNGAYIQYLYITSQTRWYESYTYEFYNMVPGMGTNGGNRYDYRGYYQGLTG